jgi:hypothetical protein
MSEDLTKGLPESESGILNLILVTIQNLEGRFGKLETRVDDISSQLQRLEQNVEARMFDTRPIWNNVVAEFDLVQAGQLRLEDGHDGVRGLVAELFGEVREVSRDQIVIYDVIRKIQLDFRNIDQRLHSLELKYNSSR